LISRCNPYLSNKSSITNVKQKIQLEKLEKHDRWRKLPRRNDQLVHAASGDSLYGKKRIEKSQLFGD
jgi:hypothetical protein